ncbi:MAG: helix-turn-helix transcriptional regulator [Rubrivivax sp.]|nr:MAG: helix-turn-helix transcriptional regulator [Rubrivivax sp.]
MVIYPYSALDEAESSEQYATIMEALARQAGGERFIVIRLHGPALANVTEVLHNGSTAMAHERLSASRHWSVDRMLDTMRAVRAPKLFGAVDAPGVEIDGYWFGVGAIARMQGGACIVYFGAASAIEDQEQLYSLAAAAQTCAQHGLTGMKATSSRACPLTERERDCLVYYSAGMGTKEAAQALGISARTVENHLDRARIRCGR